MNNFKIISSSTSIDDLNRIKNNISKSTLKKIIFSPKSIIFEEQYQKDEYRQDCRRILVKNYKILYQFSNNKISVIRIFNTLHNPNSII